jgi:glycosyltransferase involved in cell wall biosynthesis
VIPHGHYIGWYPDATSQSEARSHFNIPDSEYVYLYFGAIRSYKGLENLLQTFKTLPSGRLIIAGKPHDSVIEWLLRQWAGKDPRISLHLSFIPDEKVTSFFECADSVVLPFSDVLTSGSVILALSMGRPVIATALGCLPELISDRFGLLFDTDSPDGLRKAMIDIRLRQYISEDIKSYMLENHDWLEIAKRYRSPYHST